MARRPAPRIFGTLDDRAWDALTRALTGDGRNLSSARPTRRQFYDTFDWRLYNRGLALVREEGTVRLRDRRTGEVLGEGLVTEPLPRFVRDWNDEDLANRLRGVVKLRALIRLAGLKGTTRGLEYTDPGTGRNWRLEFHESSAVRAGREAGFPRTLTLVPLDGRTKGGWRLAKLVRAAGLRPLPPTLLEPVLLATGIRPGSYSGKVRIDLEPGAPVAGTAARLGLHLLDTMAANLKGMRRDVDTEFLHDFRVAMRRTRVLLSLLKPAFPRDIRKEYKARFRELGAITGPVRDLDVLLLDFDTHRRRVPARHDAGIAEIHDWATRRRADAFTMMAARIDDGEFASVMNGWRAVLGHSRAWKIKRDVAATDTVSQGTVVIAVAYSRVRDMVETAGERPSDEDLHRLRIAGKKFRYALEFFASLTDRAIHEELLATMKSLQDLLGEHNDLVVLARDLSTLRGNRRALGMSRKGLRAADALAASLAARREELRNEFAGVFAGFAAKKTAKKVRRLFT